MHIIKRTSSSFLKTTSSKSTKEIKTLIKKQKKLKKKKELQRIPEVRMSKRVKVNFCERHDTIAQATKVGPHLLLASSFIV